MFLSTFLNIKILYKDNNNLYLFSVGVFWWEAWAFISVWTFCCMCICPSKHLTGTWCVLSVYWALILTPSYLGLVTVSIHSGLGKNLSFRTGYNESTQRCFQFCPVATCGITAKIVCSLQNIFSIDHLWEDTVYGLWCPEHSFMGITLIMVAYWESAEKF